MGYKRVKSIMKTIGIFSKIEMAGGSEFRCVELANGIKKYTNNIPVLLVEGKKLPEEINKKLNPSIKVVLDAVDNSEEFYACDNIIIVNTDSKYFTTADYWLGKTDRHNTWFDLSRIKNFTFIFNFLISPSKYLLELERAGLKDIRIITTNRRFYDEFLTKEKIFSARSFPRMILESPIEENSVYTIKSESNKVRIGKHSKSLGSKWNLEHRQLIEKINEKYKDKIIWDFMGGSKDFEESLKGINNVILRKEFSKEVKEYLKDLDIFLFFVDYSRNEPWSRAVGEAMMSGCPIVATDCDGGNKMQVVYGSNGYLCKDLDEFDVALRILIDDNNIRNKMSKNSKLYSRFFTSEEIIRKLLMFIE